MASDGWVPEIVVGVDFGMTCTGVFALHDTVSVLVISISRSAKGFWSMQASHIPWAQIGQNQRLSSIGLAR